MPRRRRLASSGVTERAVSLFRYGTRLIHDGKYDTDLFRQVERELGREIGARPWWPSVFEVGCGLDDDDDSFPPYMRADQRPDYEKVRSIRRCLVGAPYKQ